MNAELQKSMQMSGMAGGLDGYMLMIFGIMILAGVLGGIANHFLADRPPGETPGKQGWLRYAVLGVVSALTVPLFLNMISSNLLDAARTRPVDIFVFAGFCLIYVVASRRVFENAANRLLAQFDQVRREVGQIKATQAEAASVLREEPAVAEAPARMETPKDALSYNDIEIMRAVAEENYVYGNLAGLTDKTGLGRDLVSNRLTVLKNLGVIETRISDKNVLHWYVSTKGKQMLDEILSQGERNAA